MRPVLVVVLLAACGGSPKPVSPPPADPVPVEPVATPATPAPAVKPAPVAATVDNVCARVASLQREKCGAFGVTINQAPDECKATFGGAIGDPKEAAYRDKVMQCIVQPACAEVSTCLGNLSVPDAANLRACEDPSGTGEAVGVSNADYAKRNGAAYTQVERVVSSKAQPIERCGISNANKWLESLRCKDGSSPFDGNGPEGRRVGNIGAAGRCHSIVDLYRLPCGGKSTDIYIDAYVCPKE